MDTNLLEGRTAQCKCGRREPSTKVFGDCFVYRGTGSETADETCTCGYHKVAHEHDPKRIDARSVVERGRCTGFSPRGPAVLDLYWCGCGNTD